MVTPTITCLSIRITLLVSSALSTAVTGICISSVFLARGGCVALSILVIVLKVFILLPLGFWQLIPVFLSQLGANLREVFAHALYGEIQHGSDDS